MPKSKKLLSFVKKGFILNSSYELVLSFVSLSLFSFGPLAGPGR